MSTDQPSDLHRLLYLLRAAGPHKACELAACIGSDAGTVTGLLRSCSWVEAFEQAGAERWRIKVPTVTHLQA